jgi:DNA-binding transcriptional LysR family regulator
MTTSPVRVPATGPLPDLLDTPPPLLDITHDQLRTLLVVHYTGSPLAAARILGREHSSVRKQLDTLNRAFQRVCGEAAAVKQGRGQDYLFTPTGQMAIQLATGIFGDWLAAITERRRQLGATVTVATTEFTVDFLAQIWPQIADEFTRREIELNITHVRTRDFPAQLEDKTVDLVCGSMTVQHGQPSALPGCDIIEWHREGLALITNLTARELPVTAVDQDRLRTIPLLAPQAGLIAQFLTGWYGPDYRNHLRIVAEADSIYYGLALLRSNLVHAAMLTTHAAAQATIDGRLPGGPHLRHVPLADDFYPRLEIMAGIFARQGEREHYAPSHPLNLLWNAFHTRRHPATAARQP